MYYTVEELLDVLDSVNQDYKVFFSYHNPVQYPNGCECCQYPAETLDYPALFAEEFNPIVTPYLADCVWEVFEYLSNNDYPINEEVKVLTDCCPRFIREYCVDDENKILFFII